MSRVGPGSRSGLFRSHPCPHCGLSLMHPSEPTDKDMRIIFSSEAKRLWGNSASVVAGTTFLINDPPQFLDHYYQYVVATT